MLRISRELSCDVSRDLATKGLRKEDNKFKLVQIANPVIKSVVYKL